MTTFDNVGTDQDLWHVEVAPDDVRVVTLDQLDEAFQDGLVTESMRVWQEGMPCAVSLGELLGAGDDEDTGYEEPAYQAEAHYAQYSEPQYAQPVQYAPPQYPPSQYPPPRSGSAQYAAPQYVPAKSAPPPSRAPESSWPPVIARSETPPPVSYSQVSTPVPPSMAPMALDLGDLDIQYPRSGGGKGKFLLAAVVLLGTGGFFAFQNRGALGLTPTTAAAAVQAPAPQTPPPPVSHAYDPGPPVKLGESKPPVALTVREPDDKKADIKKLDDLKTETKPDAKKVMASGKKPKAAPRTRSAPSSKPAASGFKLGKNGSKYDPLNGSL
jgi:hypothetical protein